MMRSRKDWMVHRVQDINGIKHISRIYNTMYWLTYSTSNVLCPDGKRRTVIHSGEPDTFFSQPCRVRVPYQGKRVTVSGFMMVYDDTLRFYPYTHRKNGAAFGDSTEGESVE